MVQLTAEFNHWFYAVVLACIGMSALRNPARFSATCPYFCHLRVPEPTHERLMAASRRRKAMEGISPHLGSYFGIISILLAIACVTTPQEPALWYALGCLAMASTTAIAYLQVRNSQRRRVAALAQRSAVRVLSPLWLCLALVAALAPLVDIVDPVRWLPASIVCAASLLCVYLAWRVALMQAILEGVDLPVEQFVDDRLRRVRANAELLLGFIISFVYLGQTDVDASTLHIALIPVTLLMWVAFTWFRLRDSREAPSVSELQRWQLEQGVWLG